MDRDRILSPRAIEGLIAAGDVLVIKDGSVLRLNGWLNKHPGGRLAVLHMVGRDASDELEIYHSTETLSIMHKFRIGRILGPWTNLAPPIRGGVYRACPDSQEQEYEDALESYNSEDDSAAASDSGISLASSNTSVDLDEANNRLLLRKRASRERSQMRKDINIGGDGSLNSNDSNVNETKEAYTARIIQQAVDAGIRDSPSLDAATQQNIKLKYQALHQRVKEEGYYDCRYSEYAKELTRYSILFALFVVCLQYGLYTASACFLGCFWQQIMFTAHDAGHRGITHNFVIDTLIGIFIGDFCCGLSIGWWKSSHNVHHLVTNDPEHDPDIQNTPLFCISPSFFKDIHSSYYDGFVFYWDAAADFFVKYQVYTYYPIMAIARFNLYFLSLSHLLSPRAVNLGRAMWTRPAEIISICCYWYLFGYVLLYRSIPSWKLRVLFVLVSHIATLPLHVQITLSHWGMPTADLGDGESFAQRQLRTTMDIDCPAWLDFFHGGLQFQAVHHLFPRVPRHNLRKLQVLVRQFCEETGIQYNILNFSDGERHMMSKLAEVTQQAKIMLACQQHMAATGESGLH